jgi:putative MFS transporter
MATVAPTTAVASVAARIERLPQSRWHTKVRTVIGAVTFFEAFDQLLTASTLPVLAKQWHLTTGQSTEIITSSSVGMLLGAIAAGWAGDRIGRVRTVVLGVAITALASFAVAAAPGFALFLAFRFLQGFGIGGVVPVAATYINEIAKSQHRGRFVLMYELIFPAGLAAATLVASWVVPAFGWRVLFVIGGLPAVLAAVLQRRIPESPRWLLSRGRTEEAERVLAAIEQEIAGSSGHPLPEPAPGVTAEQSRGGLRDLFTGRYLRRTVVVSALWFVAYYVNYGTATWLPSLYTSHFKLDLHTALDYTLLSNLTGLLGCLIVALLVDRVGRRPALCLGMGGAALALIVLALAGVHSGAEVAVLASVVALFVYATNVTLYLYTPELYPTRARAKGAAFGGVWNRLGIIVGPIVVGAILSGGGSLATVFTELGCVAAVGAVIALFATETRGRTLEELNS